MMRRFAFVMVSPCLRRLVRTVGVTLLASTALAQSAPALAQQSDDDDSPATISRPVVQSTGSSPGQALNAALARLARDPRNVTALIEAGNAASALGDTDAAIGFFTRADQVAPGNGQVKAQIAAAILRGEDPIAALRWFDDAEKAGADAAAMASDRGLAFDLVGDNAAAQRQYQLALARGLNDEVTRRYALSLAIAGDRRGAESILAPLVQRQERAAWRVRTFVMAITGNVDEAVAIAQASMPPDLAAGISPYLRYMPRLTPAQQAGAANLGRFPRAADVGRDDPRVVQYAALHPRAPRTDLALAPAGQALGGHGRQDDQASRARRRRPGKDDAVQLALATPPARPVASVPPPPPPPPATLPATSAAPRPTLTSAGNPWGVPLQQQAQQQAQQQGTARAVSAPVQAPPAPMNTVPAVTGAAPMPSVSQPVVQPLPQGRQPAPAPTTTATPGFDLARVQGSSATTVPVAASSPAAPNPSPAAQVAVSIPQPTVLSRLDLPPSAPRPAPATPVPAPIVAPVAQPVVQPVVQPLPPEAPAGDFRSLFDGFQAPPEERQSVVPAVDITRIARKRPEPKPEPEAVKPVKDVKSLNKKDKDPEGSDVCDPPKPVSRGKTKAKAETCPPSARGERPDGPTAVSRSSDEKLTKGGKGKDTKDTKATPSHPSRIWVQVLTGSDRDRMGTEWRGLVRQADAMRGRKPFITPWRSNFRLLTGPFESEAAAQDFLKALRKDGVSGFQWTSPAGQAVDTLPLK